MPFHDPTVKAATPLMRAWQEFHNDLTDADVVLVRIGDFYEAFGQEARVLKFVLGLTMTSRGHAPMAGIPCHGIHQALVKLKEKDIVPILTELKGGKLQRIEPLP